MEITIDEARSVATVLPVNTTPIQVQAVIAGPKGDTGAQGEQGEQGIQGEIGPQGPKGDTVSALWGTVDGSLSNQTDLATALNGKQDALSMTAGTLLARLAATGTGQANGTYTLSSTAGANTVMFREANGRTNVSAGTEGTHAVNKAQLDTKVDKAGGVRRIYGVDSSGDQTTYGFHDTETTPYTVALRDAGGQIVAEPSTQPKGLVTKSQLDMMWWRELGRATTTSAVSSIAVSSLPQCKYLKILLTARSFTGSPTAINMRFNNDFNANYMVRKIDLGSGTYSSSTASAGQISLIGSGDGWPYGVFVEIDVMNYSTRAKTFKGTSVRSAGSTVSGGIVNVFELFGTHYNDNPLSQVNVAIGGANFNVDTELVVLGHN